jgi:hypothetical protein
VGFYILRLHFALNHVVQTSFTLRQIFSLHKRPPFQSPKGYYVLGTFCRMHYELLYGTFFATVDGGTQVVIFIFSFAMFGGVGNLVCYILSTIVEVLTRLRVTFLHYWVNEAFNRLCTKSNLIGTHWTSTQPYYVTYESLVIASLCHSISGAPITSEKESVSYDGLFVCLSSADQPVFLNGSIYSKWGSLRHSSTTNIDLFKVTAMNK